MSHLIDLAPIRQRAETLARIFAFALMHLVHPGLARMRRALVRLEDRFRGWLLAVIYSAPDGMFGDSPTPSKPRRASTPPAQQPSLTPPNPKIPSAVKFRLKIGAPRNTPSIRGADWPFRKPPSEQIVLTALNARMQALLIAIKDPSRLLHRLGRILSLRARKTFRAPTAAPFAQVAAPASNSVLHTPEPHKRE